MPAGKAPGHQAKNEKITKASSMLSCLNNYYILRAFDVLFRMPVGHLGVY